MKNIFRMLNPKKYLTMAGMTFIAALVLAGCRTAQENPASGIKTVEAAVTPLVNIFDHHTIHIAVGEWAPYTGADLPHQGCDAWVVSEAFESQGYTVKYGFFPWARSYLLSKDGEWDGTMEWDDTPEYRDDFYFSSQYVSEQEWVFFFRNDRSFDWNTLEDLKGNTIGITSGYVYSEALNDLIDSRSINFEEASSDEANMRKLLLGRIDIFPVERRVGYAILQSFTEEERAQISDHPKAQHEFHPYVLLSKAIPENESRIEDFDIGFEKLKQNGRYDEIMQNCLPQK